MTLHLRLIRRAAACGLAVVLAGVGVACGGDDGPLASTAPTSLAPGPAPGPAPAPETSDPGGEDGLDLVPVEGITVGPVVYEVEWPTTVVGRPGDDAVYVANRNGALVPLRDGAPGDPVLDYGLDLSLLAEDGLLGVTFTPDGGTAYVNRSLSDLSDGTGVTEILEYRVGDDGVFDLDSERVVYRFEQPELQHNGGEVLYGPDGMLWIPAGDGGGFGSPYRYALDMTSPLGKLLRIDPRPAGDTSYSIPPDNPFVGAEGVLPEIWASGLRNPWRAMFDRETGDLWFGDVGEDRWEEINVAWADEGWSPGVTYGWSAFEGRERFNEDQELDLPHRQPFFVYGRDTGRCSISSGEIYRGEELPALWGWYVFADICSGEVLAMEIEADRTPGRKVLLGTVEFPVAVRADGRGELWVLTYEEGVRRIEAHTG